MNSKRRKYNLTAQLLCLLFLLIAVVNFTMARYQTSNIYSGTATAANWVFKLAMDEEELSQQFQVNLADTITSTSTNINTGAVAPNTSGSFTIDIDCTGCEVGVLYSIELLNANANLPIALKFYNSAIFNSANEITLATPYEGIINLEEVSDIHQETIYWKWIATDDQITNASDTAKSGKQMSITLKVTGTQLLTKTFTPESYFDISPTGVLSIKSTELNNFKNEVVDLNLPPTIEGITITEIGTLAFMQIDTMRTVSINSETINIATGAFAACENLVSVSIKASQATIGNNAFDSCGSLVNVFFSGNVDTIGSWAFKECTHLSNISIPTTVTSIGESAFYNCSALASVTLPNIAIINKWTFWNCNSLTSINIPNTVLSIEEGAFGLCSTISNVTIGTGVTIIKDSAFYACTNLESIVIPANVLTIKDYAFHTCTGLTSTTIPQTTTVENLAFYGCTNLVL